MFIDFTAVAVLVFVTLMFMMKISEMIEKNTRLGWLANVLAASSVTATILGLSYMIYQLLA